MVRSDAVRYPVLLSALVLMATMAPKKAHALYEIRVETVQDYNQPTCWGGPLGNPNADGNGFMNGMLAAPNSALYSFGVHYTNQTVWTTDFYDKNRTGQLDYDHLYFDKQGTTISYFDGHGACDWNADTSGNGMCAAGAQCCFRDSDCNSPITACNNMPSGTPQCFGGLSPGFCRRLPGNATGTCSYANLGRNLLLSNCATGYPGREGQVNYGGGYVRWGEGPLGGSWGGAGTDGGTNLVVLFSSCTEMSHRQRDLFAAFAGVHAIATTMVHQGDTAMIANRGALFAAEYQNNPYQSVTDSWSQVTRNLAAQPDCSNGTVNTSFNWGAGGTTSGGRGVNGCGGHAMLALGATVSEALNHLAENWFDLRADTLDGRGNAFFASRYECNWDCFTWPENIP